MASLKSMQAFFFPLLMAFSLSAHAAARRLQGSSSFYNAFDTNNPNPHNPNLNYNPSAHNPNPNYNPSVDNTNNLNYYPSAHNANDLNYNPSREDLHVDSKDYAAKESPHFTHGELNSDTQIRSDSYDANLPFSAASAHQPHGAPFGYLNGYDFHGPLPRGRLPYFFEPTLTNKQDGYGRHGFFSNNQQGLSSQLDNNGFIYNSPLTEDHTSPSKEENLFQSSSNFDSNYTPSRTSAAKIGIPEHYDLASDNNDAFNNGFKKEKPMTNYDRFFNMPTIHQKEVKGPTTTSPFGDPKFPLSGHDLTYGQVQVP